MPLYEYRCQSCGRTTEALQKMGDPPLKVCENCGGELKRLVSAPAVQFKGTGWYVTDYAKKSGDAGGRSGGSSGSSAEKSGSSAEKSGESPSSPSSDSAGPAEKSAPADKPAADKPAAGTAKE